MPELKREYRGGSVEIIIWRDGDSYSITFNNNNPRANAEVYARMQEKPLSRVIGIFPGVNEHGANAVRDMLFENMREGRTEVLTQSELQKLLYEDVKA